MMTVRAALCTFILSLIPFAAPAQTFLPEADERAVRRVVEAQLDAFKKDDAARAFSYASPEIRRSMGTPERFFQMVRAGYPVVYRPRNVKFDRAVSISGEIIQSVRMTDSDGRAWLALYPMERQPDGTWLISGCRLVRAGGQET